VASSGTPEVAKILIAHRADVNAKTTTGETPLRCAVDSAKFEMVTFLISEGADVKTKDGRGISLLSTILQSSILRPTGIAIAKVLISNGADVTDYDLHCVVAHENLELVRLVVSKGANVNARSNGLTPLDTARSKGNTEIIRYLQSVGGRSGTGR